MILLSFSLESLPAFNVSLWTFVTSSVWIKFLHFVQDQDYRNANVQDKISNTIAISGIPKTATMQQVVCVICCYFFSCPIHVIFVPWIHITKKFFLSQILDAFAVRDGVPMQGMKIRDVVPGEISQFHIFYNIRKHFAFRSSNLALITVVL